MGRSQIITALLCLLCLSMQAQEMPHWVQNEESKYALVDSAGTAITKFKYDTVYPFHNGVAPVFVGQTVGLVNTKGKEVARPIYGIVVERFGEVPIRPCYAGVPTFIGWAYHPNLGGTTWFDGNGKTLATGTKMVFNLHDKIPDGLWDY